MEEESKSLSQCLTLGSEGEQDNPTQHPSFPPTRQSIIKTQLDRTTICTPYGCSTEFFKGCMNWLKISFNTEFTR